MSTRIAVIGSGNVGGALARGLTAAGHDVVVGHRDDLGQVAAGATVVILAVPVGALDEVVPRLGPLDGVALVDATNAVREPVPAGGPTVADHVASLAPSASVVKAFNTIGAEHLAGGTFGGTRPFLPIAGPEDARRRVAALADDLGFDVAELGGPEAYELVEAHARLWIHLAFRAGWGRDFAFTVVRP